MANQISESDAAVKLTHQPTANSTGLAWGVRTVNGVRELQHSSFLFKNWLKKIE